MKVKTEDKNEFKLEEVPDPLKDDKGPQMSSAEIKGKYSLFTEKKEQPMQHLTLAKVSSEDKVAVPEKITVQEEEIQTQQMSPITILSEDEDYWLEEDQPIAKTEAKAETCREFSTLENKKVKPSTKKNKVEVMEFATVKHKGNSSRIGAKEVRVADFENISLMTVNGVNIDEALSVKQGPILSNLTGEEKHKLRVCVKVNSDSVSIHKRYCNLL